MGITLNSNSLSHVKLLNSPSCNRSSIFAHNSVTFMRWSKHNFCTFTSSIPRIKRWDDIVIVHSSQAETISTEDDGQRWILEPVGDGDSRHIGYKVAMPGAFEIASNEVTVGRVSDKADVVIPVATVSAQHARLEKKGDNLLLTDLNSTNSTFLNEKRLTPNVTTIVPPGSFITFGDSNLAIFRVSKLQRSSVPAEVEGDNARVSVESSS